MNIINTGLIAGLLLIAPVPIVTAADVTITINGRVVATPCTVSTTQATVDLGDLYTFNLVTQGASSPWHPVTLSLTNCPVGTSKVTATFSGVADASGNYYANQGGAGNIFLQLTDSDGVNLPNGSSKIISVNDLSQSVSFVLQVRAITPSGNVTQGSIQSLINVTYTYS
ncbi:minor fimbrial subunit [Serratia fonticola]|jgi:minor fimbrial subunit|uniref:Minor fimbrial subunit n=1 Tax=Serratia fonticola TaxID=47917 RepID=A0A542D7I9_SERFO|nr:type 1 fimbrial protein [Serratia fonticola]TQI78924.1 minor fimbrial subunit [Serratia fonticola]TQI99053.1 minor fimbrial subunit [Serratia fonticola]TVZ68578.1 minor fimbrial subunit [Serratia fonticola]